MIRFFLIAYFTAAASLCALELPSVRVEEKGFEASRADISKLLASTTRELWLHFPGYELEKIVVTRGKKGPITLFDRNLRKEIVVRLDTHGTYWSQYAYQWAHEFCHILCGYRPDGRDNKWFEETLCELASVYALRRMSESWEKDPPYPNWKGYRNALKKYADDVIESREKVEFEKLGDYYQKHKSELRKDATKRELNGAMAVAMLSVFEKEPEHWNAIRYLNVTPAEKGITLRQYFAKWYKATPKEHQPFVLKIAKAYGVASS